MIYYFSFILIFFISSGNHLLIFFLKSARSTGASFKKKGEAPRAGRSSNAGGLAQPQLG